jgi:deazaflavin-dependent oxidoreductase (nitroreductase family)
MAQDDNIQDSPVGWVAKHIRTYLETDGKKGHLYQGMPTLLLTTRGRKSGLMRRTALIYGQEGDRTLLVASNGGSAEHPAWYLNLVADDVVEVQIEAEKFSARARIATPEEKPALWNIMVAIFPQYKSYQKKAGRDIPVIVLDRI